MSWWKPFHRHLIEADQICAIEQDKGKEKKKSFAKKLRTREARANSFDSIQRVGIYRWRRYSGKIKLRPWKRRKWQKCPWKGRWVGKAKQSSRREFSNNHQRASFISSQQVPFLTSSHILSKSPVRGLIRGGVTRWINAALARAAFILVTRILAKVPDNVEKDLGVPSAKNRIMRKIDIIGS